MRKNPLVSDVRYSFWKGDLNHRKLLSDLAWPAETSFQRSLAGFHPSHILTLRTLVGLTFVNKKGSLPRMTVFCAFRRRIWFRVCRRGRRRSSRKRTKSGENILTEIRSSGFVEGRFPPPSHAQDDQRPVGGDAILGRHLKDLRGKSALERPKKSRRSQSFLQF